MVKYLHKLNMRYLKYYIFLQKKQILIFLLIFFSFLSIPQYLYSYTFIDQNFSITYPVSELEPSAGDIVVLNRQTNNFRLSITEGSSNVFGVVIEDPALVFRTDSDSVPIKRTGEVGVNVILKDGDIRVGDYITTSRIIGHGQVAKPHHRYIVGIAVEDLLEDDVEDSITLLDEQEYPIGNVRVNLKIGRHGSGVLSIPSDDFEREVSMETSATQMFSDNLGTFQTMGDNITEGARDVFQTREGGVASRVVSTGGIVAGAFYFIPSFFLSPLVVFEIFLLPLRLWTLTLAFFGIKRRSRPWGVVYDSITKQPIDPAYVQLEDDKGNDIKTVITDIDGRFGFLLEPGKYRIKVNKTNYIFPSEKLKGKRSDDIYNDLYFGEILSVNERNAVLSKNIPMDPVDFDWNEFTKAKKNVMSYYSPMDFFKAVIFKWLFFIGFIIAVLALFLIPNIYNIVIVTLYVFLFFIRMLGIKTRRYGRVLEEGTNRPMSYAVVKVCLAKNGKEVSKAVCDKNGKYFALVSNGNYYVNIDSKVGEDEYEMVYTSDSFEVNNGIINKNFKV